MREKFQSNFFLVILILGVLFLTVLIAPFLLSMFIGCVLAAIVYPLFLRMKNLRVREWKIPSSISAGILSTLITVCVLGPITGFTFLVARDAKKVTEKISQSETELSTDLVYEKFEEVPYFTEYFSSPEEFKKTLNTQSKDAAKFLGGWVVGFLSSVPEVLLHAILVLITCFFALKDGPATMEWLGKRVPLPLNIKNKLSRAFMSASVGSMGATLASAAAQAFVIMIGFFVTSTPFVLTATGVSFIFSWLPLVGTTPVWVLGCIYHFITGSIAKGLILLGIGMFAGVVDNIVRPWFLKGSSEMHPLLSLVVTFGGVVFFGIFGVFVGPALAGLVVAMIEIWPTVAKERGWL